MGSPTRRVGDEGPIAAVADASRPFTTVPGATSPTTTAGPSPRLAEYQRWYTKIIK